MKANRHVPIIWGILFCGLGIFLMFKFDSIVFLVLGGILIIYGFINLKIGFTVSNKALRELTSPNKDVSEETKKEINEKL